MLRQNINQTFSSVFLVVSLSLCSLNAFSDSTAEVEFMQGAGTDTFTVTASPRECIGYVSPWTLQIVPEYSQTMTIRYLKKDHFCSLNPSIELFEVQNNQHPYKIALFKWLLRSGAGEQPSVTEVHDPDGFLSFDTDNPEHIKVKISYSHQHQ
ncbi:hypothetical protein [Endozoicomonas sp. 4G]|uniref:hypothetical protein n=1 Tax=Endozoicomonas sp. 4G TaxID=2872754 RepID=UPI002078973B|nr:hypothetical protein [Endozoicomonas sp. 4G]